jgi:hypothetical protein
MYFYYSEVFVANPSNIPGAGATLSYAASGSSATFIANITKMSHAGSEAAERDLTCLGSSAHQSAPSPLPDNKSISLTIISTYASAGVLFNSIGSSIYSFIITFVNGDTMSFQGWVNKFPIFDSAEPDNTIMSSLEIRITGQVVYA